MVKYSHGGVWASARHMKFVTSKEIDTWVKEHNKTCHSHATAGEHYQFEFIPTGVIEVQTVKCLVCGEEKSLYIE